MKKALCCLLFGLCGCAHIPEGVNAVSGFDPKRYLGTWHEIARLDHSFERGLVQVTATYSLNADGSLRVLNRGFDPAHNRWKQAEGRAYVVSDSTHQGRLRVSFFWPFYGGYNIIELDHDYSYALVCGDSRSYLWILARQPELPESTLNMLTQKAKTLGFSVDALIHPQQKQSPAQQTLK